MPDRKRIRYVRVRCSPARIIDAGEDPPDAQAAVSSRRLDPLATVGAAIVLGLVFCAIFAPVLTPYTPTEQDLGNELDGPSATHLLGTDHLGRDVFTRILYGTRYALAIAVFVVSLETLIGVSLGLASGYYRGR
ncbi:ABC transporter permease [Haloplanus sp. GCM10025708]|uniref:ABC transporter permease n=1 Tax=Haloplanus sp. GCM10025708 TaxID=3252679 RepID=UPI00360E67F0